MKKHLLRNSGTWEAEFLLTADLPFQTSIVSILNNSSYSLQLKVCGKGMTFQEKNLSKISLSPTVTLINAERLKSLKNGLLIPPFPDSSQ